MLRVILVSTSQRNTSFLIHDVPLLYKMQPLTPPQTSRPPNSSPGHHQEVTSPTSSPGHPASPGRRHLCRQAHGPLEPKTSQVPLPQHGCTPTSALPRAPSPGATSGPRGRGQQRLWTSGFQPVECPHPSAPSWRTATCFRRPCAEVTCVRADTVHSLSGTSEVHVVRSAWPLLAASSTSGGLLGAADVPATASGARSSLCPRQHRGALSAHHDDLWMNKNSSRSYSNKALIRATHYSKEIIHDCCLQ